MKCEHSFIFYPLRLGFQIDKVAPKASLQGVARLHTL
jgi:hypothetical protein